MFESTSDFGFTPFTLNTHRTRALLETIKLQIGEQGTLSRIPHPELLALAICGGVVTHHGIFIHGEWHMKTPRVVFCHLAGILLTWYILGHVEMIRNDAMVTSLLMFGTYLLSLFTSMTIYRVFFHRLKHFSGPALAKVTKFWHVAQCVDGRNHMVLQRLHEQYGDFVRSGPNEITVFRPGVTELLDMPKSKTTKSEWYDALKPATSAVFERDPVEHKKLRHMWSQALSVKAVDSYLPRILNQVDNLSDLVAKYDSKPLLINDIMAWYSFDSMGEFLFNEDFGMMKSTQWHPSIIQQKRALSMLGMANDLIWGARFAFAFVPWLSFIKDWLDMVKFCDGQMEKRMQIKEERKDIAAWFIDEYRANNGRTLEQRRNQLSGNTTTAIVAGSDTTRANLIAIWYFLAKHPEHQDRIFDEISNVDITKINTLAVLPHLNGCINEALRLIPAQLSGGSRFTPPEGLFIDEVWIPGGTKVVAPKWVNMQLPTAYEDPHSFVPERWTSRPEMVRDASAFQPFNYGPRQCIGKYLALVELRLSTAALVKRFRCSFAPDYDEARCLGEMRDLVTAHPGDCWLTFAPRSI